MISLRVKKILKKLPLGVDMVAAVKDRTVSQVEEAVAGGAKILGENYLKQARDHYQQIGGKVKWHFIGHLQSNKARKAVKMFDMIETLDSFKLAEVLESECRRIEKKMPVLIEVNSASEKQKHGFLPSKVADFVGELINFSFLELRGLMTMGPFVENSEDARPYFRKTKLLFDQIKNSDKRLSSWDCLSMGMSSTYRVALEEGANIIRIGTAIFGPRPD